MKAATLELSRNSAFAIVNPPIVPPLEARRKLRGFERYGVEKEEMQRMGTSVVRNDKVLERLIKVWKSHTVDSFPNRGTFGCLRPLTSVSHPYKNLHPTIRFNPLGNIYPPRKISVYKCKLRLMGDERIKGLSADDVEMFSLGLEKFQNEEDFSNKAGIFLSILINYGQDEKYIVHTAHLSKPIHRLGEENRKTITVKGDVGDWAGIDMKDGALIVEGKCEDFLGYRLESGEIIVMKTAVNFVGYLIKGGSITVRGKTGDAIGHKMTGGEIHLEDEYESIGRVKGGRIFHKEDLIAGM